MRKEIFFNTWTGSLMILLIFCFNWRICFSQHEKLKAGNTASAYVDENGILRWTNDNSELALFGVNYTVPFAHSYRAAGKLKSSREQAIDDDVYHFDRLGLDAFRVHVWDCEISDTLGNLLENDHLRLFDYLVSRLKDHGIKMLITPIAYWGNGYPEPDEKTPGFSAKFGKEKCLTDPDAATAQENYLYQFTSHVNQFTGIAYKDDPDIIAFEICNEPHHQGTAEATTAFINRMVNAIKKSGCIKPVFYNVSHSIELADAYFNADIQGGTFQWYPTGLVRGMELKGNFLANVASYNIPFAGNEKFKKMARVVYEFDAADIGRSYMYPYMAKSYREAGFQFAAQFAYDAMFLAFANTDYQTHYLNLAYTPQKAISLKIAGEVFRQVERGSGGDYPADTVFGPFRVSYKNDLSEMITDEKFFYTNNTSTRPPAPAKLKHLTGYGNSTVVSYEGLGAYFLDNIVDGVWRLEVMPDAIWVHDPFQRTSLKREAAVIIWKQWPMDIYIPSLGADFQVSGINQGNNFNTSAVGNRINVSPGVYLLARKGVKSNLNASDKWENIRLDYFVAPQPKCSRTYILHNPVYEIVSGKPVVINASVISLATPVTVNLYLTGISWRPRKIEMKRTSGYSYSAEIPAGQVREGFIKYFISAEIDGRHVTFPGEIEGSPADWDFFDPDVYEIRIVKPASALALFNAGEDGEKIYGNWRAVISPSVEPGREVLRMNTDSRFGDQPFYAFRYCFKDKIRGRKDELISFRELVFSGYSGSENPENIQLSLILDDGSTYGANLSLRTEAHQYMIPLNELKPIKPVNLPNAYPTFQPMYFEGNFKNHFDISRAESIQVIIGPSVSGNNGDKEYNVSVDQVFLE